jgi:hypothetical protein
MAIPIRWTTTSWPVLQMSESENYIKGLAFSGAHAISGDGMAPVITNGRKAAKTLLDMMEEEGK